MKSPIYDEAMRQLAHAGSHGWLIKSWSVGVTALDGFEPGVRTEDVKHLLGYPVERSLDLPRDAIRIVQDHQPSCRSWHWCCDRHGEEFTPKKA